MGTRLWPLILDQSSLRDYWGPAYAEKPSDSEKASKFFDFHSRRNRHLLESSALKFAIEGDFGEMIMRAKHSAGGEDGVPYAAYKANSILPAKVLYNGFVDLTSSSL